MQHFPQLVQEFFQHINFNEITLATNQLTQECKIGVKEQKFTLGEWLDLINVKQKQLFLSLNDQFKAVTDDYISHFGYLQRIISEKIVQIFTFEASLIKRDNMWKIDSIHLTLVSENKKMMDQLSLGMTKFEYKKHLKNLKKPKRIILVRHGESQGNIDNKVYATIPDNKLELTENGKEQARSAGHKLKEICGDQSVKFFLSPFQRTRQTFENIALSWGGKDQVVSKVDPRLREQEWGNYQDPKYIDQYIQERRQIGQFYYRFPTGESGSDVGDRVSTFLESLHRDFKHEDCARNIILVTHGLTCRLFLMRYFHWDVDLFHSLWNFKSIPNDSN